jgi:tRNA G18 (ribose-2'-O)-methylase SpoU
MVFDKKLSDVNFHFTKNTKNQASKPQIKIVIVDKDVLYKITENIMPDFFLNLLEPFDIESYKLRYENEVGFISLDNIENSELGTMIKTALIENLSDIAKINPKGNKL